MKRVRFRDIDFEMKMVFDIETHRGTIIPMGKTTFADTKGIVAAIPVLGIIAAPADVYQKYTDSDWHRDWSGVFLYESDQTPEKYVYYKQGDIRAAVRNYLTSCGRIDELNDDIECLIKLEVESAE